MYYVGKRICVLGLLCLTPSWGHAQTGQATEAPEGTAPSVAQPSQQPAQPTTPSATGGDQSTQAPAATAQEQLPAVQVVQPKPKPQAPKPAAVKPKIAQTKVTPPPAPVPAHETPPAIDAETSGSVMSDTTGVPMSPVSGAEIPLDKVPGGVSILNGSDFGRQNYITTPEDVLQQRVPGVIIDDVQGNQFQTNVQFRGFESSPVNGVPQGLAVYENGVRINESFGDVVNWDFLPSVAINNMAVVTNNPVYGLNALGGAIAIDMKNGFNYHGVEVTSAAGSFGRVQGSAQAGLQEGNWAVYFGGERIHDDGYRDFSEAEVRRMFADIGFKNSVVDLHFNVTGANNFVGVTAAAPVQLLGLNRALTFTSPQTTSNKMIMPAFNGTLKVNDNLSVAGVAYFRNFIQGHVDGNISEAEACDPPNDAFLCISNEELLDAAGIPVPTDITDKPLGSIDRTSQTANSWGTAWQAVNKAPVFGHTNQFLIGSSYDHGDVDFNSSSELGFFEPKFVVKGLGITLSAPDDLAPRSLATTNDYTGVYFSDTFDANDRLAFTVGGRYNYARIGIDDLTGNFPSLSGTNIYERFNPAAGATYKINPNISLYGGYSEANRAPVAAELACSDPNNPCLIESFLTSDPPLKQVVSHTWEAGVRGERSADNGNTKLNWSLGLFRTENTDDIITVFSTVAGRGVFENGGDTLRQGVEANLTYKTGSWFFYANYALVDATFETPLELASPNNPQASLCHGPQDPADPSFCVFVRPGDHLPGIPENRFKAGADYWITPKWKFGGDLLAVDSQVFFGDESNLNDPLGGYMTVNLHTSYDITPGFQIYGLINNLFDQNYGVFGTFFNVDLANSAASADPKLGPNFFSNARTITPGAPFEIYGGAKVKF